jgi:hypothetical protein
MRGSGQRTALLAGACLRRAALLPLRAVVMRGLSHRVGEEEITTGSAFPGALRPGQGR